MHLVSLNMTQLLLKLFRGTMKCDKDDPKSSWVWAVLQGNTWKYHGEHVASSAPYLPGSFDKAPRNPAEKVSSNYKAQEYLTYIYGLCPGLLYGILPEVYWKCFCKLVVAIRILHQRSISRAQVRKAYTLIMEFIKEFEELFYQRKVERIHFCRQCIHGLVHLAPEVVRIGPDGYRSQFPMERTIGILGQMIKQPSNPYANLSERGVQLTQLNALSAMIPQFAIPEKGLPFGAIDLEDGFALLRAKDSTDRKAVDHERQALIEFFGNPEQIGVVVKVRKWARLLLPNGQIARSAWKEKTKKLEQVRMSRNVKIKYENGHRFAEVQYYFQAEVGGVVKAFALSSIYSTPNATILQKSNGALAVCKYKGPSSYKIIPASSILSVVAMVPFPAGEEDEFFLVEKLGLDLAHLGGYAEDITPE
ncbi:hypothetical protein SCHPADRAFT_868387 [Schizopora paradoxa]|uniref:Uncharacterized protein n=1 Tax=Schizopora paradoxa TaxID=27342 RepID=A0A0H2RYZ1_9AGAM|nr:hypothetical protein SCHPADRAFT_868387 [Schizopora paradoxa]